MTEELDKIYSKIHNEGKEAIISGNEKIDPVLNDIDHDKRYGLSLIINIRGKIADNFRFLEEKIREIEPKQYYYPESDLHITVIDIVKASEDFQLDENISGKSLELIEKVSGEILPFNIIFKGIILSSEAILTKGFYEDGLNILRQKIRERASKMGLILKERYQSMTAHSTIVRFKTPLINKQSLISTVQSYTNFDIGKIKVNELELVIHDWYNRRKEIIGRFAFNKRKA